MIDNNASPKQRIKPRGNDKLRQNSQESNSSASKFLKRKPDHKKILMSASSKKKRDININDYFNTEHTPLSSYISSDSHIPSKFISSNHIRQKQQFEVETSILGAAKSEGTIFTRKKQIRLESNKQNQVTGKINREQPQPQGKNTTPVPNLGDYLLSNARFQDELACGETLRKRKQKKSKTEFFSFEQVGLCEQVVDGNKISLEMSSTQEYGDLTQEYMKLKSEFDSLLEKNRWLQQQLEVYAEKEYLLSTAKQQLEDILKEKQLRIERLQGQKSQLKRSEGGQKKREEQLELLKISLAKEELRNAHLKEESNYIQNELILKNEELIKIYNQYSDLQAKYRKEKERAGSRLEKMRAQIEKLQGKNYEILDYGPLNQSQKWRQKCMKLQEQLKYLQIKNQCLLMCKQELTRSEGENRKLRDQRDYFKMKVMQNIKRGKNRADLSNSGSSSIILQLSDTSINNK